MYTQHQDPTAHRHNRRRCGSLASIVAMASLLLVAICTTARSQEIVRDNFDYTTGDIGGMFGGTGSWSTNWFVHGNQQYSEVVAPSTPLSFNGLGGGNALQLTRVDTNAITPAVRGFTGLSSGQTFYQRFLIRLDSDTWDGDDFFTGFADNNTGNAGSTHGGSPNMGLRAANPGDDDFFARLDSDDPLTNIPSDDFAANTTYLILAKFEDLVAADDRYDQASIWVNPSPGDEFSPDAVTALSDSDSALAIDSLGWRFGTSLDSDDVFLVDDVAITTDFASAVGTQLVPEPGTFAIWGLVAAVALLFGWRKAARPRG